MNSPVKIMFLCTGNSCRSQMAQGFVNHMFPGKVQALSAGVEPSEINPTAVLVMNEAGIDIQSQGVHRPGDYSHVEFDYIITLCDHARQNCPYVPGWKNARRTHLGFPDPATYSGPEEDRISFFRKVRDDIRETLGEFIEKETGLTRSS